MRKKRRSVETERERESREKRERMCKRVCVCVCERESMCEWECVCTWKREYVYVREREGDKKTVDRFHHDSINFRWPGLMNLRISIDFPRSSRFVLGVSWGYIQTFHSILRKLKVFEMLGSHTPSFRFSIIHWIIETSLRVAVYLSLCFDCFSFASYHFQIL